MSTYKPHTLVTFGGTLNRLQAPAEIWQCGVRVMNVGMTGPVGDSDAYLAGIQEPLSTWFANPAGTVRFPGDCTLDWVKANPINAAGKYADPTTHLHDYSPVVPGGLVAQLLYPDIIAVAVSWGTAKAVRKGSYATHGRIYLPLYQAAALVVGSMRMAAGVNALTCAVGTALLHVLANSAVPAVPIVASGHSGEVEAITSVRVGDVFDVQRRRKDALKEVYSSLPFVTG